MKSSHNNTHPLYLISKLLMNSLYGRFAMSDIFENHIIIDMKDLDDVLLKYNVADWLPLDHHKVLISYTNDDEQEHKLLENYSTANISIAIASAITGYARIFMSQFKNSTDFNLFYSDTDSIIIDKPLQEHQVESNP